MESVRPQLRLCTSLSAFGFSKNELMLLMKVKEKDSHGNKVYSLPSTEVRAEEDLVECSESMLIEAFGKEAFVQEQLKAFIYPISETAIRRVNIAQFCLIPYPLAQEIKDGRYEWKGVRSAFSLSEEENEILIFSLERLKRRFKKRPIAFELLPTKFTITEMQHIYEQALRKTFDKRNFRKKLFKSRLIKATNKKVRIDENIRPSELYYFDWDKFEEKGLKGYDYTY